MMRTHAFRLNPGDDLKNSIETHVSNNQIAAGIVLTCVGSLSTTVLRMAGAKNIITISGEQEIVSLAGTLSYNGCHLHLSVSDKDGKVKGGHLKAGCIVRTTAEVVIAVLENLSFHREHDAATGFKELQIKDSKE
jgi:predicted DNA-binding protein with PD1-like motif